MIQIEDMTQEGNGVGKIGGYTVFVPDTAIGDLCRIKLVKKGKHFGYGRLLEISKPSGDRIAPDCIRSSRCGGCSFRHISYPAELSIKENIVRNAFERIGGIHVPVKPIIGSSRQDGYRNKAQYPVALDDEGNVVSGFYARRSHRIVPADNCLLQPPVFAEIQQEVLAWLKERSILPYQPAGRKGLVRHIYVRLAEATGEIMLCLVVSDAASPALAGFGEDMAAKFPAIKSIVFNENALDTNVILGKKCVTVWGTDTITDVLCGVKIRLSPLSFYQVNRIQAEALYQKALSYAALTKESVLLDLYCGAGTIGLAAARNIRQLIGVEIVESAVKNARENAELNGIGNARFFCGDAGKAAEQLAGEGIKPDVVIIDPPRKGLDRLVIESVAAMAPQRIVMVSCNPATAARDTMLLQERGYVPAEVTPVDMFPRTPHTECVVLLEKREGKDDVYKTI